ncbi:MAG: hypothetical protein H7Z12_18750 [Rhodospirillaceae bacterium]|nr:hypothetical protein [Rhodospirillales bacterium]
MPRDIVEFHGTVSCFASQFASGLSGIHQASSRSPDGVEGAVGQRRRIGETQGTPPKTCSVCARKGNDIVVGSNHCFLPYRRIAKQSPFFASGEVKLRACNRNVKLRILQRCIVSHAQIHWDYEADHQDTKPAHIGECISNN